MVKLTPVSNDSLILLTILLHRGIWGTTPELTCFVCYFKIINTFLEKNMCTLTLILLDRTKLYKNYTRSTWCCAIDLPYL